MPVKTRAAAATMLQRLLRGRVARQITTPAANKRQRRRKTAGLILKCLETLRTLPEEMKTHIELDETIRRVLSDPLFMTQAMFTTNASGRTNYFTSNVLRVNDPQRNFTNPSAQTYFAGGVFPNLVQQLNASALVLTTTSDQLLRCAARVDELLFSLFSIQDDLRQHALDQQQQARAFGAPMPIGAAAPGGFAYGGLPGVFPAPNVKASFCGSTGAGAQGVAKKFICESSAATAIIRTATRGGNMVYFEGVPPNIKVLISYLLLYSKLMGTEFKFFTLVRDTDLQRFNNSKSGVALLKNMVLLNTSRRDRLLQSNAPAWMTPYMIATEFAGNINQRRIANVMKTASFNKIGLLQADRLLKMIGPVRKGLAQKPLDNKQRDRLIRLLTSNEAAKNYDVLPPREVANILKTNVLKYYSNQLPANLATASTKQKSMAKIVTLALKYMVGLSTSRLKRMIENKNATHAYQRIASEVVQHLRKHASEAERNVKTAKRVRITKYPKNGRVIEAEFSGNILKSSLTREQIKNGADPDANQIKRDLQKIKNDADSDAIQMLQRKFRQAQNGQTRVAFTHGENYYTITNITR